MKRDLVEHFLSKVSPCPVTGCWWWAGGVDKDGYGKFQEPTADGQKHHRAHRFIFAAVTGVMPEVVMHRCDQPTCVNPDHLEAGTHLDNVADRHFKGHTANQWTAR